MVSITRLSGGLTPGNGSDPRTFPAIWNATADELESLDIQDLANVTITSATTGQILEWNGSAWVNGQVDAAGIASNAVETAKINNNAVTTAKIADANVTTAKIADANVTSAKLGPGTILQVQHATLNTVVGQSSATWASTGLELNITPRNVNSQVMLMADLNMFATGGSGTAPFNFVIRRNDSESFTSVQGAPAGSRGLASTAVNNNGESPGSISWLDSPATTSPVKYTVYYRRQGGSNGFGGLNRFNADSDSLTGGTRLASYLTAMEVAG
jgi:hypothetical protein